VNPVYISTSPVLKLSELLEGVSFSSLFVLTDENTQQHCYPLIQKALPKEHHLFTFPAGESHKNLETCASIWSEMTEAGLDRKALCLNIGGGVLGDMGGFCASIYKRGIRFINMPTTLLSQVDASVGGKLGIDFEGLKNHLGVFNEPEFVLISPEFLKTLPENELRSGFAEIIKHGLIQDHTYFEMLNFEDWKTNDWEYLIEHSVAIKKAVVQEDPKEAGLRKILNFGHTIGHALETHFLDGPNHLLHGEAIAAGMICEAWLSVQKTGLSQEDLSQIQEKLLQVYGKIQLSKNDFGAALDLCLQDKKNEGKEILFSLLENIGNCTYNIPVSRKEIEAALSYYCTI